MTKELPKGWIKACISDIFDVRDGTHDSPKYLNDGYPLVTSKNIKNGKLNFDKINFISKEDYNEINKRSKVDVGDVLFSMIGTIGSSVVIIEKPAFAIKNVALFKPHGEVIGKFLKYYLDTPLVVDTMKDESKGTTQKFVSLGYLRGFQFPLPPLPEQQRIVAKLDTLFGHLDALNTRLDRIPKLLKDFRQKVLTQAVTGKLTEEWREGKELDSKSYNLICDSIKERSKFQKVKKSIGEIIEISDDIPFNWVLLTPDFIATPEKYALGIGPFGSNLMVADYEDKGVPLVFVRHIKSNDFKGMNPKYVSTEKAQELFPHSIDPLDLLITKMGDPPGDCVIYPKDLPRAIITSDCLKFRVWDKFFDRDFIKHATNSFYIKEQLGLITKGVAQQKISLERFKTLHYPIPPLTEQQEIVSRVESLFAKADQIEASYQKLKVKIEQMPQALLAKAFRGELVEQLPTDGDARELLEEIRKAKAGLEKGGRTKKMKENDEVRMVAEDGVRYGKK